MFGIEENPAFKTLVSMLSAIRDELKEIKALLTAIKDKK